MLAARRPLRSRTLSLSRALAGACLWLLLLASQIAQAQGPGRVAVATAHPLATEAALQIFAEGGNAFDAAVAASAALAVVEPYGSGMGGGGFFLLRQAGATPDYRFLDGRERAPLAAHAGLYLRDGKADPALSLQGPLAAAIPGLPALWVHLAKNYGRLPLQQSLAPAIHLAREGFTVDDIYRQRAGWRLAALRDDPPSAALFLLDGELPPLGHRLRQPELAESLTLLAEQGHAGFYAGPLAARLLAHVQAAGGIWSERDLAEYRVIERDPLRFALADGHTLIGAPLPSAGGIALAQSLGILQRLDWRRAGPTERIHLTVEALRRAYRDRGLLGDGDFVRVPGERLLSAAYLDTLAAGINRHHATPSDTLPAAPDWREGSDTTHFSVLDGEGNAVAATQSLNFMFGAAFSVPGSGIVLNNQMDDFASDPNGSNAYRLAASPANAIAPGKRPLSSMSPTFIESEASFASFGTPGGSRIPSTVLLAVLAYLDHETPARWVSARRFHHQYRPDVLEYEEGAFDDTERSALTALGHRLQPMQRAYGNLQVIHWDKRRAVLEAASDPRGIGRAATAASPKD